MKAPILLRTEKREPSFRDLGVSRAKKDEKSEYYFHSIIRYNNFWIALDFRWCVGLIYSS